MVILLLYYHLFIIYCCETLNEKVYLVIRPNETLRLNLSTIFIGSNMTYYPNDYKVNVISSFNEKYKNKLQNIAYPITLKSLVNQYQIWLYEFAFLTQDSYYVNITYSTYNNQTIIFDNILQIQKIEWEDCFDIDYYNTTSFLLLCKQNTKIMLYIVNKNLELEEYILEDVFNATKFSILTSQKYFYLFQTNKTDSNISIFQWDNNNLVSYINITTETIRQLLQDYTINFKVNKFQLYYDDILYIHDQTLGLFQYQNKQLKLIKNDQMKSFYYDFQHNQFLFLYNSHYTIEYNNQIIQSVDIEEGAKQISFTGNYILIQGNGYFSIYSPYSNSLLQKIEFDGAIQFLTQNNYLTTLTNQYSHVYYLSHPYIIINESLNINSFIIQGYDNNSDCSVQINIKQIAEKDNYLLKFTENSNQTILSSFYQTKINEQIIGPNKQYTCEPDKLNCSILQIVPFTNNMTKLSIIIQQQIQIIDNQNHALVQLLSDSQLIYSICQLQQQSYTCVKNQSIQLFTQDIQWKIIDNKFYYIQRDSANKLELFTLPYKPIGFSKKFDKPIKQYIFNKYLIVLLEDEIIYYYNIIDSNQNKTYNRDIINQFNQQIEWNPSQIYTNPNSDTFFIVNNKQLLITTDFNFFYIKFIIEIDSIQTLYISQNTFVAFSNQKLLQYNYQADVYFMNELPLYNYEMADPLNIQIIDDILILQTNTDQLLFYQLNTMSHNSLFQIINLQTSNKKITKSLPLMTGCQLQDKYFIIIYDTQYITQYIYIEPIIQYDSSLIIDKEYSQFIQNEIKVKNEWNEIQVKQNITLLNTQTQILLDEKQLRDDNKVYLSKQEQKLELNNSWYTGQVVNFTFQSEIQSVVTVHNLIDQTQDKYSNQQDLNNIFIFDNQVLQGYNSITLLDEKNLIQQIINFDISLDFKCIQTIQDENFYYTLCNNKRDSYLHLTLKRDLFPLGLRIKMDQFTYKIGMIGSNFIYLNDYSLKIGKIILNELRIENQYLINSKFFKINGTYHPIDFEINCLVANDWIIQIIDQYNYLSVLRGTLNEDKFNIYFQQNIHIKQKLIEDGYYLLQDTQFKFIKYLFHNVDLGLNLRSLLITNNVGSYSLTLGYSDQIYVQFYFSIVQYGNWLTYQCLIHNKTIAILYRNQTNALIGVYQIDYTKQIMLQQSYSIKSGIQLNIENDQDIFYYFNETFIYVQNEQNQFQGHKINEDVILTIQQAQERQKVYITAFNDFGQSKLEYIINYNVVYQKSNTWWIILVSVISGTIIVVVCFYCYKKRYPSKSVDVADILL